MILQKVNLNIGRDNMTEVVQLNHTYTTAVNCIKEFV